MYSSPSTTPASARRYISTIATLLACLGLPLNTPAWSTPTPVWTEHNDNSRTGQNLTESTLTPADVNQTQFGKLFEYNLDDQSYSQPLYVPALTMSVDNQAHNVVFVTTVNNSVYAFDADSGVANGGQPLWKVNLTPAGGRAPNVQDADALNACGADYVDFANQFGIVGSPVIDTSTGTLYVVARTFENGAFIQRLHALSLTSGAEKFGGPIVISGSYSGVNFDPLLNNQRPALALVNGTIYIGWSSHCDTGNYHGWLMAYSASTLQQTGAWSTTNNKGSQAGFWQAGQGVTVDASGNLYLMTGNGSWDGVGNFGDSLVKLSPALTVLDYFTPNDYATLNVTDGDLGSAGALGIPGTTLLFGGGKQGMVYLIDSGNLGHESATDNVVQEFQATFPPSGDTGHIHGSPVYFNSAKGQFIYLWGENDYLHVYQFTNGAASNQGTINSTPVANSTMRAPVTNVGMPGGFMSISANGNQNGIVWAYTPLNGDANHNTAAGILHAFDAQTFNGTALTELWNSQQNATRDTVGNYGKFTYPTIANGKVYVSTFGSTYAGSGQLIAYGEGPSQVTAKPVIKPNGGTPPATVTITDTTPNAVIYYTVDGAVPVPGQTGTFQYTAPFTAGYCETITAMALVPQTGWIQSANVTANFSLTGTAGSGTGLVGTYYNDMTLTGSSTQRIDPTINFSWPNSNTSPMTGIGPDNWSVAWTGYIQPEFTDTYTFTTITNDGVRLWVNGQEIINDWQDQPAIAKIGSIALTAGLMYPITMDYYQDITGASAQLYWQSSCQPQQIVPATQLYATQVTSPTFSPAAGPYAGSVPVTIADSTPNASIYYTTDGSTPSPGVGTTQLYSGQFTLTTSATVNAIAVLVGDINSAVVSAAFSVDAAAPTITPAAGSYAGSVSVSITGSTPIASIYYTTDGSAPSPGVGTAQLYSGSFTLTTNATVNAIAVLTGDVNSAVVSAAYSIAAAAPTIAPAAGEYTTSVQVTLADSTPNSLIYYTTDGATPSPGVGTTMLYSTPFTLTAGGTVNAIAASTVNAASSVASASYTVQAAAPTFSPSAENIAAATSIAIADATPGVSIYYTTNGKAPSPGVAGTVLYSGAFSISPNTTVEALATLPGDLASPTSTAVYDLPGVERPSMSPKGGTQVSSSTITMSDTTPGASIYYTLNGSKPSPGGSTTALYTAPFTITTSCTVEAEGVETGYTTSSILGETFTIQTATPRVTPNGGTQSGPVSTTLTDSTSVSTIYYTVDGSTPSPGVGTTQIYTAPLTISPGTTIEALATAPGQTASAIVTAIFR